MARLLHMGLMMTNRPGILVHRRTSEARPERTCRRVRTELEHRDSAAPSRALAGPCFPPEPRPRAKRPKRLWPWLAGLGSSLISPAVWAQISVPAPRLGHLVSAALITLAVVILILTQLRRHRTVLQSRSGRRQNASGSDRRPPARTAGAALEETDHPLILEAIGACIRRSRREGGDLGVIRLRLDATLDDTDRYSRAAIDETLMSIARMRAARLFLIGPDDYLLLLSGELPDQARRIAEDFREGVVDLALTARGIPLTASIGLYSGPVDAGSGAQHFIDCAEAQLRIARKRGGNRVEAWLN
jgi:GGDEF domain-containing protein